MSDDEDVKKIISAPEDARSKHLQDVIGDLDLDDLELASELVPGTVGAVAIYTSSGEFTHLIRKVMIRLEAIMNYINPV